MKTLGDGPSFYQNMAYANAIAHQNRMQTISEATVGSIVKYLTEIDVREAAGLVKGGSANAPDLATTIAAISGALNANTQGVKSAVKGFPPLFSPARILPGRVFRLVWNLPGVISAKVSS